MHVLTQFFVVSGLLSLCLLASGCQPDTPPQEVIATQETTVELTPLEQEVLKLLKKEDYDEVVIFDETKELDLDAKLALVNRLAEAHQIERMNLIKARVKMGTIDKQQAIAASEERQKEILKELDSTLREWAQEEGVLEE